MTQSESKMDNFYFGIGGEHHVIGNFIMRGYEATKISPDFGYDIHITNKYLVMKGKQEESKDFYLQVKTRLIQTEVADKTVTFYVEKDAIEQMISDKTAILVCVMMKGVIPCDSFSEDVLHTLDFNQISGNQTNLDRSIYRDFEVHGVFWLSNSDMAYLINNTFLGDYTYKEKQYKTIRYNFQASHILGQAEEYLDLTDSRKYLFSITDLSHWTFQNRGLFY